MSEAHQAVPKWLGQSGQCNSRIEALYQAMEDQDMTTLRAMMEGAWSAGHDAARLADGQDARSVVLDFVGGLQDPEQPSRGPRLIGLEEA